MVFKLCSRRITFKYIISNRFSKCLCYLATTRVMNTYKSDFWLTFTFYFRFISFIIIFYINSSIITKITYCINRTFSFTTMTTIYTTITIYYFRLIIFNIWFIYTMFTHIITSHTTNTFIIVYYRIPCFTHILLLKFISKIFDIYTNIKTIIIMVLFITTAYIFRRIIIC